MCENSRKHPVKGPLWTWCRLDEEIGAFGCNLNVSRELHFFFIISFIMFFVGAVITSVWFVHHRHNLELKGHFLPSNLNTFKGACLFQSSLLWLGNVIAYEISITCETLLKTFTAAWTNHEKCSL